MDVYIVPLQMLLAVGLTVDHFKYTSAVIQSFAQREQRSLGKIVIKTRFDEIEDFGDFLVINMDASYNVLLADHGCIRSCCPLHIP